ncbi:hypothetical protein [Micromonospora sp. CPCC 206061]|uniref:hypothetical protein n=1 Tax=Micromonospora sp. CPCC 206061 TaxID=3122410 RepID=UPI002FF435D3
MTSVQARQKDKNAIVLSAKDAQAQSFDNVTVYSWDTSIPGSDQGMTWTMGVPGTVVGGGIHVHGWYPIYTTDSYPADSSSWKVGVWSDTSQNVDVTVYAISMA